MTELGSAAPITRYTNRIVTGLRRVAESDQPHLTFSLLIDVMGRGAHRLLILVLTLLNMIPGPPGFGGTIAWTTFAVALAMVLGRPIWMPGIIGDRKLPLKLLLRGSVQVAKVAGYAGRFSRPRLRWMTGGAATIPYGIFTMVVSVVMTIPIPLLNAIPNVGLCIVAFSMLNRDGVGVVIGTVVSLLGLAVAGLAIFGVFHLGMTAAGSLL